MGPCKRTNCFAAGNKKRSTGLAADLNLLKLVVVQLAAFTKRAKCWELQRSPEIFCENAVVKADLQDKS